MMLRNWHLEALAAGAWLCLAGSAFAGDTETFRLDLRGKPLTGDFGTASPFEHSGRAKLDDDDLEDVHYRYWRGYWRGYYGTGYYLPRLYAFRSGYWNGWNGGGYYPRYFGGYYGSYYNPRFYGWGYNYPSLYYYSSPVVYSSYYWPCNGTVTTMAPVITTEDRRRMPEADEPPAVSAEPAPKPRQLPPMKPADAVYPYDGPAKPRSQPSTYPYNGDPQKLVPLPKNAPQPKIDPADGRLVKFESSSPKVSYPAYGDHRRPPARNDATLTVKRD